MSATTIKASTKKELLTGVNSCKKLYTYLLMLLSDNLARDLGHVLDR